MKAILFDFGGTLDTDGIHWSEKFWNAYKSMNLSISKKQFEESFVYSENSMQGLIKSGDSFRSTIMYQVMFQLLYLRGKCYLYETEDNNLMSKISELCYSDVQKVTEQSKKIVKQLSGKYILGVVSNFYGNLDTVLKELKLREYFDIVIDSELVRAKKPDPKIFQIALDKIKVTSSDALVVGDSYDRDIQPAKRIGCTTMWLDGVSWTRPKDTHEADYIINSINEIENILLRSTQEQ
jgi:putative hydrolase of the HAD superfamily